MSLVEKSEHILSDCQTEGRHRATTILDARRRDTLFKRSKNMILPPHLTLRKQLIGPDPKKKATGNTMKTTEIQPCARRG